MNNFSVATLRAISSAGSFDNAYVNISDGIITSISQKPAFHEVLDLSDHIAIPGFIDIHTHGYFGVDSMESSEDDLHLWARRLAKIGVTSFVPTCVSAPIENLISFIEKIRSVQSSQGQSEAKILGGRSEGPYISPEKRGAHNPKFLRGIDHDEIVRLVESTKGALILIDMAPELDGFPEAMSFLQRHGTLVSIGHSSADFNTARAALTSGVRLMTHFYNAMTQFDHRNPGMVGAGLISNDGYLEIISDFHHVSKEAIKVMVAMRGWDHVIGITDSLSVGGTDKAEYHLGGMGITVHDEVAWIKGTNTIAGSVLTLGKAFINLSTLGSNQSDLVKVFSKNPARLLGINDRGDILPGQRADLNFLNNKLEVRKTMLGGTVVS